MILVDTNIWIDHFNKKDAVLASHLNSGLVSCHPFIIGELACGNLSNRTAILGLLQNLPSTPMAAPHRILEFIDKHELMGKGLGYIDIHLLLSTILAGVEIWTADKRLNMTADALGISYLSRGNSLKS
jgi:predicted nucleic acid-binding protein